MLPSLREGLRLLPPGLFGQLLLTLRQFAELLESLVDFAIELLGRGPAAGFVLVLLEIHFELEHLGEVTARLATAASATASLGDLNAPEDGFRPPEILQRLLLRRKRITQILRLQQLSGRSHLLRSLFEVFNKRLEILIGPGQVARAHAVGQRAGLVAQGELDLRQQQCVVAHFRSRSLVFVGGVLDQIPGAGNDLFLAARDFFLTLPATAHSAARLPLHDFKIKRTDLDEIHVRL